MCPVAVFTQKSIAMCNRIRSTLQHYSIQSTLENNTKTNRGSNVKISGFLNVRQLIACFGTQAHSEMIGVKYCDLLKMQALFRIVDKEQHNTTCGRCQIIDLKYSLHSADLLTTQSKQSSRHALTRSDCFFF